MHEAVKMHQALGESRRNPPDLYTFSLFPMSRLEGDMIIIPSGARTRRDHQIAQPGYMRWLAETLPSSLLRETFSRICMCSCTYVSLRSRKTYCIHGDTGFRRSTAEVVCDLKSISICSGSESAPTYIDMIARFEKIDGVGVE